MGWCHLACQLLLFLSCSCLALKQSILPDRWTKPKSRTKFAHWVPFPAPGPPKQNNEHGEGLISPADHVDYFVDLLTCLEQTNKQTNNSPRTKMTVVFSRAFFLSASIIEGIEGFSALGVEGAGVEAVTVLLATGMAIIIRLTKCD